MDASQSDSASLTEPRRATLEAGLEGARSIAAAGRRRALPATVLFWLCAVTAGASLLWNYALAPGAGATAPNAWPRDSKVPPPYGKPTLLVFIHPQCPCSRATIGELARLMTDAQGKVRVHVLFLEPEGVEGDWVESDLWESAARIPGIELERDRGGIEARRFGSITSGQTLLYDTGGTLAFDGGITSARGHEGDNDGRTTLTRLLLGGEGARREAPVFGCTLFEPGEACTQGVEPCSP